MTNVTMKTLAAQHDGEASIDLFDNWFDLIETSLRERVRGFIEQIIEAELDAACAARDMAGRQGAGLVRSAIATVTAAAS